MLVLLSIVILIMSVVIHELSHGYMADYLGDPTPRLQGRLTLNPIKHLDPFGSVIVPVLLAILNTGFIFGWAKPVEYNPYNIRDKRRGEFLIAAAGPLSNLSIALIFGVIIRFALSMSNISAPFIEICTYIVIINIVLAIFNLIPLPPLDGSKLLFAVLPNQYGRLRMTLEAYAPFFVLIVLFFLWQIVAPVIPFVFKLFTGVSL